MIQLSVGCRGPISPGFGDRPNIVLILVDALRADHLPIYGYDRNTSPAIAEIADNAVVFRKAYSQAPFTPPSIASLMTSTYPTTHGAKYPPAPGANFRLLPESLPTIPEVLGTAGYHTIAVSSHPWINPAHGFGRGFLDFEVIQNKEYAENRNIEPQLVVDRARRFLEDDPPQPFFMYVHLMGPHWPYQPEGKHDVFHPPGSEITPFIHELDTIPGGWKQGRKLLEERARAGSISPADLKILEARYDGMIRQTDSALGLFFKTLRDTGISANTVVVLTADHGDEFLEHGSLFHTKTLFNELLHIPLIISHVTAFPDRVYLDELAESIDIPSTIVEISGAEAPPGFKGRSLFRGKSPGFAVSEMKDGLKVQTENWSVIVQNGNTLLFDLERDPLERVDVADKHPRIAEELLARAVARIDPPVAEGLEMEIEEETSQQLQALGYLGTASVTFEAEPRTIVVCDGTGVGVTTLNWDASHLKSPVEIHVASPTGKLMARSAPKSSQTTGKWVRNGMRFFLVDAATGATIASTTVQVTSEGCGGK